MVASRNDRKTVTGVPLTKKRLPVGVSNATTDSTVAGRPEVTGLSPNAPRFAWLRAAPSGLAGARPAVASTLPEASMTIE